MSTRSLHQSSAILLLLCAGGCVSTDPASDVGRAADAVEARAGARPDWSAPWDEHPPTWDARADLDSATAVALALARNPTIRVELETIAASRADLVQAGLLPNPVLNFSLGFPIAGADGGTMISASLMQSLIALFQQGDRKAAAQSDLDERILSVSDEALRLVAQTRAQHVRIAIAQRSVRLQESLLESVNRSSELTQRRVGAGEASRLDANRVQLLRLDSVDEAARTRSDLAVLKRRLLQTLGMADAPVEWSASDDVLEQSGRAIDGAGHTEQGVVESALAQRLDVASARAASDAALARAGIERKGRIAEFAAGAEYERDEDGRDTLGPALAVEIPIFDTGDARIAKAVAEARGVLAHERAVRQAAIAEVREAWERFNADLAAAARLAEQVTLADTNLMLGQSAFDAGLTDLTALLDVQRDQTRTKLKLLGAQERVALGLIELERAAGGQLETPNGSAVSSVESAQ